MQSKEWYELAYALAKAPHQKTALDAAKQSEDNMILVERSNALTKASRIRQSR